MGNQASTPSARERTPTPSSSHQDSLLKLLNKTAASSESSRPGKEMVDSNQHRLAHDLARTSLEDQHFARPSSGRQESPIRLFGSKENMPTPFQPQDIPQGSPSYQTGSVAYVNPFEGPAALTPRQIKNPPTNGSASKRVGSQSPAATHTSSRRKLTPSGDDVMQSIEGQASDPLKDGRTPVEALMGIGAPSRDAETVAQALNEVGGQVDRQVENALAQAEGKKREAHIKQEEDDMIKFDAIEEHVHDAAVGLKSELDKEENKKVLRDIMPPSAAEAVKDIIDEAALDDGQTNGNDQLARQIKVYQFPMYPFVSIDLVQKDLSELSVREGSATPIARFKKEFDQADRTLATATNEFIAYAVPKNNGGIRVIEQDNGKSSLLFGDSQDRIFNIGICTAVGSPIHGLQRVIATGVSGAVYWATIAEPDTELSQEEMKITSVVFPPTPAGSDSTSGGQLKTRAKKSSRHPDFFAIGRGKAIQIVFPAHARNSDFFDGKSSSLDTERYFADRNLKITTGKAGKDFTFSEDDSTIVTLDKAGKLRIWDIRELTDGHNQSASRLAPVEVKTPMLTFATAHASEKSWPTSVLFADKLRPYTKGTALRYIIVGMKQNHTLQLWDLCLGKAVQELRFPHEKETDAICSVTYHPSSGVIAVGHPTRNSIYFIHLSAPKYNLPSMSQAKFVQRLANKDSTLPKAEATAIMSGMREYSLADKGQLRSIELTPSSGEPTRNVDDDGDPMLFELYLMHSKGLHCLSIKKEDLGWSHESKVLHPVDAEAQGLVVVKELREPSSVRSTDPSSLSLNGEDQASVSPAKNSSKTHSKGSDKTERSEATTPSNRETDKKKAKRNGASETASQPSTAPPVSNSYANAAQQATASTPQPTSSALKESSRPALSKHASREAPEPMPKLTPASVEERAKSAIASGDTVSVGISGDFLDKELKKIEQGVSNEFSKVLGRELDSLYKHIAEDKRVQDASGAAKQDAVLRLVSSTLGDNVEKSLSRIIQKSIKETVLPSISELTTTTVTKQLHASIGHQVQDAVPAAMKHAMHEAMNRSMQSPDMFRTISEQVSKTVSAHVEREISTTMTKSIAPGFQNVAMSLVQKTNGETERRVRELLVQADGQRRNNSVKIDQLTTMVTSLTETVRTMAEAQTHFQHEILKLRENIAEQSLQVAGTSDRDESPRPSDSVSQRTLTPEEEELNSVTDAWNYGAKEEATVLVRIVSPVLIVSLIRTVC